MLGRACTQQKSVIASSGERPSHSRKSPPSRMKNCVWYVARYLPHGEGAHEAVARSEGRCPLASRRRRSRRWRSAAARACRRARRRAGRPSRSPPRCPARSRRRSPVPAPAHRTAGREPWPSAHRGGPLVVVVVAVGGGVTRLLQRRRHVVQAAGAVRLEPAHQRGGHLAAPRVPGHLPCEGGGAPPATHERRASHPASTQGRELALGRASVSATPALPWRGAGRTTPTRRGRGPRCAPR